MTNRTSVCAYFKDQKQLSRSLEKHPSRLRFRHKIDDEYFQNLKHIFLVIIFELGTSFLF